MTADEQAIRQLVADWMRFTQQGDIDSVLNLMCEDATFLIAGRPPMVGRAAFAAAARGGSGPSPKFEGTSDIQEVHIAGDTATMWSKLRVAVTLPGQSTPIIRSGTTLTVFRKTDSKWRLWRDANLITTES